MKEGKKQGQAGQLKGKIISARELRARWAYSELNSSRFAEGYKRHLSPSILQSAKDRVPFDHVRQDEWPDLALALAKQRGDLIRLMDRVAAGRFTLSHWSPTRLLNCVTLPIFGTVQFLRFLAMPPLVDAAGQNLRSDPRYASTQIPYRKEFVVAEPIIALNAGVYSVLLDGYLRSILWLRNPQRPIPVWVAQAAASKANLARQDRRGPPAATSL